MTTGGAADEQPPPLNRVHVLQGPDDRFRWSGRSRSFFGRQLGRPDGPGAAHREFDKCCKAVAEDLIDIPASVDSRAGGKLKRHGLLHAARPDPRIDRIDAGSGDPDSDLTESWARSLGCLVSWTATSGGSSGVAGSQHRRALRWSETLQSTRRRGVDMFDWSNVILLSDRC